MPEATDNKSEAESAGSEFRETIVVIVQALLIALVFRTFLYQPFSIPTASMQPTLLIGDYVITSKFTWGFGRYSFPFGLAPINGRLFERMPDRGDIAVFRPVPQSDPYIKRVIGLPGDRIQMVSGILNINGVAVTRKEIGRATDTDSYGTNVPVIVYEETLPNGVVHLIHEIADDMALDNTSEFLVPAGHYFMMGDNRDRSQDSRVLSAVGFVPSANLISKGQARFFSINNNIPPWQIWQWPANLRLDRMFQSVYN